MDASALAGEERIIWLADIAGLDYVRQTIFLTHRRRGKPAGWRIGRLVGYAELRGDVPNDGAGYVFARRVFYLMAGDRDGEPDGTYRNQRADGSGRPADGPARNAGRADRAGLGWAAAGAWPAAGARAVAGAGCASRPAAGALVVRAPAEAEGAAARSAGCG